jgi:sulfite dehydrogenase (quinone) subunit SoeC
MHPAYSVILFTTLSGAGYGLFIWLAGILLIDIDTGRPVDLTQLFWGLGLAVALMVSGLFASTSHLGRPERAWRAFSQWRTSWLSREGVCAVATFVAMAPLVLRSGLVPGAEYLLTETVTNSMPIAIMTLISVPLAMMLALGTVVCTGMIYQSLPTIRAWHQPLVTPIYVALALASGGVLLVLLQRLQGIPGPLYTWATLLFLALGCVWKILYWRGMDTEKRTFTAESATGLGSFGKVRSLDQPHTQANYLMREMGYQVARKHAVKLRRVAVLSGFVIPALLLLLGLTVTPAIATLAALLATLSMAVGLFTERWLFFAEAEHVVMLYYGRASA